MMNSYTKKIVLGTRGSRLAMWQAEWVKAALEATGKGITVELSKIKTTGDKILDVPLAKVGGKGLFVKEIEEAMLRGEIDIAVHSMKDVPTDFPDGLHLAVICEREDPRDALISNSFSSFYDLPHGARVGTSSLRRSCQLLSIRPDLNILSLRGNLDTRLGKLDEGQFDAIILAAAGVKRLGWQDRITQYLSTDISLPAIGQGAIGIECRRDDAEINLLIGALNHNNSYICVSSERACLKKLEGGCQVPIAAHAEINGEWLTVRGLVGSLDGKTIIKSKMEGNVESAGVLGESLGHDLLDKGAKAILDQVYGG